MHSRLTNELDNLISENPGAVVGLAVRDKISGLSFDYNANRSFHAASTMKIPVMFEAYRRDVQRDLSLADSIEVRNEFRSIVDGSLYSMQLEDDSDDSMYDRIGQQMSIRDLVYQMITVSSNLATNVLIDLLGAEQIQSFVDSIGVANMKVLRGVEDIKAFELGLSNTTTASDLAMLLDRLGSRQVTGQEADGKMIDVLLDQQFNQMIPQGLPPGAKVAHKTGRITQIHHDAAIVYPTGDRDATDWYVIVILIEGLEDESQSALLGSRISRHVHSTIR